MSQFLYRSGLKHLICFIAIIFFSANIFAQQSKPVYNLLWRISGQGLSQPSYLFGTMHVKDKRVFNFSDSLMLAIQKSKSFALEVHPDSLIRDLFEMMQKGDSSLNLHKLLSDKEYDEVAKKFEEKNGYKMRDDMNPLLAESMLKKDKSKPGDYDSFLDAYLYGIARTMDKKIYGLENTSQQLKKEIGSSDEIKERLLNLLGDGDGEDGSEEMIQIYSTGNLDKIWDYAKQYDLTNLELIARNKVMVASIINDSKSGSLFAAVGAAHLPGNDGIISLLRKQGYTVEPVKATFTGVANKYHIDYDHMKWVTHADYEMGYSLEFPSEPINTKVFSNMTTWMYPDISNENYYGIYVMREGTTAHPANREKVINNIIQNFGKKKKGQIISKKNSLINGLPCIDLIVKDANGYQRYALLVNNNMLYYMYMGKHLKSLHSAYANRFFNSFKSFSITEKPINWMAFKHDTGAFSIKFPAEPKRINQEVKNPNKNGAPFKINMFVATDPQQLATYLVRYNDYPEGNYIADRDVLFDGMGKDLAGKAKMVSVPKKIWKDGYEGREVNILFEGGYYGVVQLFIRGNRVYLLLKEYLRQGEKTDANDPFFNSFAFIPYTKVNSVDFPGQNENFTVKFPTQPKTTLDSNDRESYIQNAKTYSVTSPASGGMYILRHYNISKYYRTTHIDSLYKDLTNIITGKAEDSVLNVDTVVINNNKAREIVIENKTTHDKRRYRILIDDGEIFTWEGYLASKELFNDESDTFYTSFERTSPALKADLLSSKADLITKDLRSSDTSIYKYALGALSYYKYTPDDLPSVFNALKNNYPDDTLLSGSRYKLIKMLKNVHNETTIDDLKKVYADLKGKDLLKSIVLRTIPQIDTAKGYDVYFNFLTTDSLTQPQNTISIFNPLYDSLGYAADHFQKIIPLVKNTTYRSDVLTLATKMISEKNEAYTNLVRANFKSLTAFANDDLRNFLASKDTDKSEWKAGLYGYLNLMKEIKGEPLTNQFTNYYIENNPKGVYLSSAVIARINNHLPTKLSLTASLMDSIDTRYDIMEALYRQKQFEKVPIKYKKQDEFAKLCLYQYIGTDDYGSPTNIKLLGSVMDKGLIYYAYKFALPERADGETYIAIAGPYKPGSTKLDFDKYNTYTNYDMVGTNWIRQAKKLIPDLIKAYKSN